MALEVWAMVRTNQSDIQAALLGETHRTQLRRIPVEVAPSRVRSDPSRPKVDLSLSLKRRLKVNARLRRASLTRRT